MWARQKVIIKHLLVNCLFSSYSSTTAIADVTQRAGAAWGYLLFHLNRTPNQDLSCFHKQEGNSQKLVELLLSKHHPLNKPANTQHSSNASLAFFPLLFFIYCSRPSVGCLQKTLHKLSVCFTWDCATHPTQVYTVCEFPLQTRQSISNYTTHYRRFHLN